MKYIIILLTVISITSCGTDNKETNKFKVEYNGALKNMMHKGDISATVDLKEFENIEHFYALGAIENLKGENADQMTGIQIVNKAVESPLRTIVENAGGEGAVVINKVLEGKKDYGYDAKTDTYVDMLKAGIIDPKKVTRIALENAASVAGMILTTECALVDIKEDNAGGGMPGGMGGGMPGMM